MVHTRNCYNVVRYCSNVPHHCFVMYVRYHIHVFGGLFLLFRRVLQWSMMDMRMERGDSGFHVFLPLLRATLVRPHDENHHITVCIPKGSPRYAIIEEAARQLPSKKTNCSSHVVYYMWLSSGNMKHIRRYQQATISRTHDTHADEREQIHNKRNLPIWPLWEKKRAPFRYFANKWAIRGKHKIAHEPLMVF